MLVFSLQKKKKGEITCSDEIHLNYIYDCDGRTHLTVKGGGCCCDDTRGWIDSEQLESRQQSISDLNVKGAF